MAVLSVPWGGAYAADHRKLKPQPQPVESLNWPESEIIFVYDNTPYTFGDVKVYHTVILNDGQAKPMGRAELRQAVDSMVLDMALHEDAMAKSPGIMDSPEVDAEIGKFRLPHLRRIFYEKEVAPKVKVTLDEFAETLPLPGVRYEISMIVAEDQGKINMIAGRLKGGESFPDLARKHSEGFSADKGGRMGLVREDKEDILTRLEFQNLKKVPESGITEPFNSRIGWVIVKVDRIWHPVDIRREEAKASFPTYRVEKEKEYFRKRMDGIRGAAKIEVDQPFVDELALLVKQGKGIPEEKFTKTIASVNGRKIFAGDVRNIVATHSEESLNLYLERRIEQELIAQEAEKTSLPDAEFGKIYRMKKQHEIARFYLRDVSQAAARTDEKEMKEYYKRNKSKFTTPERRLLLAIETRDEGKARKALEQVKKGMDFREAAKTFNDNEDARRNSGVVGLVRKEDLLGDIAKKAFSMKSGAVAGPLRISTPTSGNTYVIVKVETIRPASIQPYGKVEKNVLRDRIVSRKRSAVYEEFLPKILAKHSVELKGKAGEGMDHDANR